MLLDIIFDILALIVTLGILVTFHEYGHFWVARRCGVKVLRFSVGFGKPLKSWYGKDGVEYVIAPIPLGGYVQMLGQEDTSLVDPSQVPAEERNYSFACKPLWQRSAIVAAGPLANFLLAFLVYWIINIGYGINGVAPVISGVIEDSPAARAGLQTGDEILAVDGEATITWQQVGMRMLKRMGETGLLEVAVDPIDSSSQRTVNIPLTAWMANTMEPNPLAELGIIRLQAPARIAELVPGGRAEQGGMLPGDEVIAVNENAIHGWSQWVTVVRSSPELMLDVVVKRNGLDTPLRLQPERTVLDDGSVIGTIGAAAQQVSYAELVPPELRREINYGPFSALIPALGQTWDNTLFIMAAIKKLVIGLISVKNINGPITIAQVAGDTASYGLEVYLGFLALLSISLGVFNLLPVPILDGGHLLYFLIEGITRRPVPQRLQNWGLQLGLLLIVGIMTLAFYNDITRLL
ncbi:MAG: RIP metalloprotease RseP [Pseudohongiellaceae bacterium]